MPVDISRVCALCFDVDGTLRDTDDQLVARLGQLLQPLSFLFPQRDPLPFARRAVMALEDPANFLHGLPDRLGIDHYMYHISNALYRFGSGGSKEKFWLIEGVREMLIRLQPNYPMAIVSARGQRSTMAFLDHFELTPFFEAVATAHTCRHTKPYPDPILWAVEKMKVPSKACLMIGDTTVDVRAGKAAGAQTVGVLCGFGQENELVRAGADLILPATPDLTGFLLRNQRLEYKKD